MDAIMQQPAVLDPSAAPAPPSKPKPWFSRRGQNTKNSSSSARPVPASTTADASDKDEIAQVSEQERTPTVSNLLNNGQGSGFTQLKKELQELRDRQNEAWPRTLTVPDLLALQFIQEDEARMNAAEEPRAVEAQQRTLTIQDLTAHVANIGLFNNREHGGSIIDSSDSRWSADDQELQVKMPPRCELGPKRIDTVLDLRVYARSGDNRGNKEYDFKRSRISEEEERRYDEDLLCSTLVGGSSCPNTPVEPVMLEPEDMSHHMEGSENMLEGGDRLDTMEQVIIEQCRSRVFHEGIDAGAESLFNVLRSYGMEDLFWRLEEEDFIDGDDNMGYDQDKPFRLNAQALQQYIAEEGCTPLEYNIYRPVPNKPSSSGNSAGASAERPGAAAPTAGRTPEAPREPPPASNGRKRRGFRVAVSPAAIVAVLHMAGSAARSLRRGRSGSKPAAQA